MLEITQTKFGPGGNCFAACLASILELDISGVPDFPNERGANWLFDLNFWLYPKNMGAMLVESGQLWPPGYAILSATTRESGQRHCVVVRDGTVVWDPSPMSRELLDDHWWVILTVLDPSKPTKNSFT